MTVYDWDLRLCNNIYIVLMQNWKCFKDFNILGKWLTIGRIVKTGPMVYTNKLFLRINMIGN